MTGLARRNYSLWMLIFFVMTAACSGCSSETSEYAAYESRSVEAAEPDSMQVSEADDEVMETDLTADVDEILSSLTLPSSISLSDLVHEDGVYFPGLPLGATEQDFKEIFGITPDEYSLLRGLAEYGGEDSPVTYEMLYVNVSGMQAVLNFQFRDDCIRLVLIWFQDTGESLQEWMTFTEFAYEVLGTRADAWAANGPGYTEITLLTESSSALSASVEGDDACAYLTHIYMRYRDAD